MGCGLWVVREKVKGEREKVGSGEFGGVGSGLWVKGKRWKVKEKSNNGVKEI